MYNQLSLEEKKMMVRQRFKNGKDLHTYLNEHLQYFLPDYKNCRLEFLHQLMSREKTKKWLHRDDVSNKLVPTWPELSVKRCYHNVIECCPDVLRYLPDPHGHEQKLPEREFFWKVVRTLYPKETEMFIQRTADERRQKDLPFNKKINMAVDDDYLDELLKYDFTSKQKGNKKLSSVLMQKNFRQRKPKDRNKENPFEHAKQQKQNHFDANGIDRNGVLNAPPGLMNVKLWHDRLNSAQKAAYQRGLNSVRSNASGQLNINANTFQSANGDNNDEHFQEFENQDNQIEINN